MPRPLPPTLALLFLLPACTPTRPNTPPIPLQLSIDPWPYPDSPDAKTLHTPHYLIHTTVSDSTYLQTFAATMEGAYQQYRALSPGVPESPRPLECFLFATRPQWSDFTRAHTGRDADTYLSIPRGAYTVGDWYVSYYLGDLKSLSIAAHEGFHQYVGRNFTGRLPPFLEEGTACLFESLSLDAQDRPHWNFAANLHRAQSLRTTLQNHTYIPLAKLITMHAGDVLNQSGDHIEAFYAQSWAFARFLQSAENARYLPAFQRLLADTAAGTVYDPTNTLRRRSHGWNPTAARPLLEHYLNLPLPQIESHYQAYLQDIAFTHFEKQWNP